jgi:hypothetical protein
MPYFTEQDWKKREEAIIPILEETIKLMQDMTYSFQNDYPSKRISLFRQICAGYLMIGKNNAKASLLLIENNLTYQIHYISRNMFEMVVTLHFIDNDKLRRDELAQRFFDYTSIQRYKVMEAMNKNRSIPQEFRTEEMDKEIEKKFNSFLKNYRTKEGKPPRTDTWSGLSLPEMINTITNNYKKNDFLTGYDIMNRPNNQYLHPTVEYVKNIVKDELERNVDYKIRVSQLESIYVSSSQIIEKFLDNFQKNRPLLRKRFDNIENSYKAITKDFINLQSMR